MSLAHREDLWLAADPSTTRTRDSPPQGDSPQSGRGGFLLRHTPVQPLDTWRAEASDAMTMRAKLGNKRSGRFGEPRRFSTPLTRYLFNLCSTALLSAASPV